MSFNLDASQLMEGGVTAVFNGIGLFTGYGCKNSQDKENDRGSNGGDFEIVKGDTLIDRVNRNAEIMQSGKGNNCEENKFPKSFVSHTLLPTTKGFLIKNGRIKRNYFHYLLSLRENQSYFRLKKMVKR
jgi:hypothetical protein